MKTAQEVVKEFEEQLNDRIFEVKNAWTKKYQSMSDIRAELGARFFVERFGAEHPVDRYWGC